MANRPFPYLEVTVTIQNNRLKLLAYADSGFEGAISLPLVYVERLGEPDATSRWQLADSSLIVAFEYVAEVQIESFPPITTRAIATGDECLVGRRILDGFKAIFDHGRELILEP